MFQGNCIVSWLSKVQFDVDPTLLFLGSLCKKGQEQKIQSRQKEQMEKDMPLLLCQTPISTAVPSDCIRLKIENKQDPIWS